MRQELPRWERGWDKSYLGGREGETKVTWVGERVRQELPGWERG